MNRSEELFEKNVERWSEDDPKKGTLLPYHDASDIELCKTDKGELNLASKKGFLHDQSGAKEEAEKWFSEAALPDVHILYIYGVGLGYYYDAVKAWLEENPQRFVVFLEDNLSVIYHLLWTEQGEKILTDDQVKLLYFEDLEDEEATLEVLYWTFALTKMAVSSLKSYGEYFQQNLVDLKYKITYDAAMKNALVEEYVQYGAPFFKNFYPNMLCLAESLSGNHFFNKFEGVPAIICGAGPSLGKHFELLRTLGDRALIFAGGSSLNALSSAGILPHFGAGIDPNPTQHDRLTSNRAFEVPFFYRNRLYHQAFRTIHGSRLYISGTGGYDVADYFEEKLSIKEDFLDEGHNVVNFTLQLAYELGCDPIITVGVDLAYTDMHSYAPGIIADTRVKRTEIINTDDIDTTAFLRKDIHGEPIYTLWKWIAESDWIGDFVKERRDRTFINCTEGGLGFPGVANRPFKEIIEQFLTKQYSLKDRVYGEMACADFSGITFEKMEELAVELRESLFRSAEHFRVLYDDAISIKQKIEQTCTLPDSMQGGLAALAEVELEEESGYQYVLDIFNAVFSRILNRELQQLRILSLTDTEKAIKRLEINCKRFKFLQDVAKVNIDFIDQALKEKREALVTGSALGE